jgi:hypothetical protein
MESPFWPRSIFRAWYSSLGRLILPLPYSTPGAKKRHSTRASSGDGALTAAALSIEGSARVTAGRSAVPFSTGPVPAGRSGLAEAQERAKKTVRKQKNEEPPGKYRYFLDMLLMVCIKKFNLFGI